MFPMSLQPRTRNPRRWFVSTSAGSWSNFRPLSLSPSLWFDASDTSSITSSSGLVSQWNDLSGNDRHLTQGTAANQPTTGVTTQNGLNVINFSTKSMTTANSASSFPIVYFFAVVKSPANASNQVIAGVGDNAAGTSPFFRWSVLHRPNQGLESRLNGTLYISANNQWNAANWQIFSLESAEADGYVGRLRIINGAANPSLTYPNALPLRVGARLQGVESMVNGSIAEILIFNRRLNEVEKDLILTYFNTKWAVY